MDRSYLDSPFLAAHYKQLALDIDHWARQALPPLVAGGHDDIDATRQALVIARHHLGNFRSEAKP